MAGLDDLKMPLPSNSAPGLRDIPYQWIADRMRTLTPQEESHVNGAFQGAVNPKSMFIASAKGDKVNPPTESAVEPDMASNVVFLSPEDVGKPGVLTHEATHVYQALRGDKRDPGVGDEIYNYGGTEGLSKAAKSKRPFSAFNPEQQGAIIGDSYGTPTWRHENGVPDARAGLPQYQHYLNEVRNNPAPAYSSDGSDAFLASVYQRNRNKQGLDRLKKR